MANWTVTKAKIGYEDLSVGTSTFTRATSVGGTQTLSQIPLTGTNWNINVVTYSATPTFDASSGNVQQITLTGNVTSSTLSNPATPQILVFEIIQDGTGGHTFAWPSGVLGGTIDTTASVSNFQIFYYNGTNAYPLGPVISR